MLLPVKQLTCVLSERLGWDRAWMRLMTRPIRALRMQATENLSKLTLVMKLQVKTKFGISSPRLLLATRRWDGFG